MDLSRTVGWFTALYPVRARAAGGDEPGAALDAVVEQLRAVPPAPGLGYGLLRYLSPTASVWPAGVAGRSRSTTSGQFDRETHGPRAPRARRRARRRCAARDGLRPHLLDIDAAVIDGRLRMVWTYARAFTRRDDRAPGRDRGRAACASSSRTARPRRSATSRSDAPAARAERDAPLVAVPRGGPLPLSFMQERLWFLDQLEPGAASCNTPVAVRLRGQLDVERLRGALDALVARHESLRTRFPAVDGAPVAVVAPPAAGRLPVTDSRGLPDRAARARGRARGAAPRRRGRSTWPADRWCARGCCASADDEHVLVVAVHHIVADGWSAAILLHELGRALRRRARSPPLPVQYADYAAWERERLQGERLERQLAYWRAAARRRAARDRAAGRPRRARRCRPTAASACGAASTRR